jgi:hypothetical protein
MVARNPLLCFFQPISGRFESKYHQIRIFLNEISYFGSDYVDDLKVGFKKGGWGEMETSPLFLSEINQRVGGSNPFMGEKGNAEATTANCAC